MVLTHRTEPQFSQPVRQIVMMLIVLGLTIAIAVLIAPQIMPIFMATPYLKIFIVLVFFVGVAACFWQVVTLISSVNWIEGFALDRPGHEFTKAPRLLAPLAAMLSGRHARRSLTSTSTRSILETVATRIEEQRDLTRYLISLLIFLGLLGTFYGLATVVPAVVDTIRSLAPQEDQSAMAGFDARDATSADMPVPDFAAACARPVKGLRVGVPGETTTCAGHLLQAQEVQGRRIGVVRIERLPDEPEDAEGADTDGDAGEGERRGGTKGAEASA